MNSKKGITSIVTILILISLSVGIGLGAYYLSDKIKQPPSLEKLEQAQEAEQEEKQGIALPSPKSTQEPQSHFSVPQTSPSPTVTTATPSPSPIQALQVNFSKTGNILNWDAASESETDIWRFLWDEPGALALTVDLEFNQQSQCHLGLGYQVCDQLKLVNGERVNLEGNREGDKVTVIKLKRLDLN